MMRTGLRMLNCHSAEAVMVGDRMDTDVISGLESGMSTVLVLSGVSTMETLKHTPTVPLPFSAAWEKSSNAPAPFPHKIPIAPAGQFSLAAGEKSGA